MSSVTGDNCTQLFFFSSKFCQALPIFKGPIFLPQSRKIFHQAWNCTDLSIYWPHFEGKCNSRKFDIAFSMQVFLAESCQKIKFSRSNQTIKMDNLYLWMLHDDQYLRYPEKTIMAPKFTFKLNPAQFVSPCDWHFMVIKK